jgi:ESS family glutamate:Na+ symporter
MHPSSNGGSFGLTVAAMGFVSAGLGGVVYLQRMRKKGLIKSYLENADEMEDLTAESITEKGEIPLSESLISSPCRSALWCLPTWRPMA